MYMTSRHGFLREYIITLKDKVVWKDTVSFLKADKILKKKIVLDGMKYVKSIPYF